MSTSKWKVVRFNAGGYGACRQDANGQIQFDTHQGTHNPKRFDSHPEAIAWVCQLNGEKMPARRMGEDEFIAQSMHVPMMMPTRTALRAILVDGWTWKRAAALGITESGILRAMRRMAAANHP